MLRGRWRETGAPAVDVSSGVEREQRRQGRGENVDLSAVRRCKLRRALSLPRAKGLKDLQIVPPTRIAREQPAPNSFRNGPDENGRFGIFGGRFVAETLMPLVLDLEHAYGEAKTDPAFHARA